MEYLKYYKSKPDIVINCLAVKLGLRAMYWCSETNQLKKLKQIAEKMDLEVSEKYPRVVYNPKMVSLTKVENALDDKVESGKLFGYPTPGEDWGIWWIEWIAYYNKKKYSLFVFQANDSNFLDKLVNIKNKWNDVMQKQNIYIDFEVRYRKNKIFHDDSKVFLDYLSTKKS